MRTMRDMHKRDHGQIMILFGLFLFVLVGALALALDAGYLMSERRQAQSTADAAALAGARRLMSGDDHAAVAGDALGYIGINGVDLDADTGAAATIVIDGDDHNGTVMVDLTVPVTRFFIGAIYTGDWAVSAHAVAEVNDNKNGRYAIIALEEPGISVIGAPGVDVIGGGAFSNGDVARSGQANVFTVDMTIDAAGSVDEGNLWEALEGFHDRRPVMDDPLFGALPPDSGMIEEREEPDCWNVDCILEPGYYAGMNIRINQTATLNPGLYYFHNTQIRLIGTNPRIEGEGVMLYFDGNSSFEPGTAGVYFTAPATSPYTGGVDGMAVWIANCSEFESSGNNEFYVEGIFYAPCSYVWMHGNPYGVAVSGQVIVGTLDIRGTSDFLAEYVDYVHTPRLAVFLIE